MLKTLRFMELNMCDNTSYGMNFDAAIFAVIALWHIR